MRRTARMIVRARADSERIKMSRAGTHYRADDVIAQSAMYVYIKKKKEKKRKEKRTKKSKEEGSVTRRSDEGNLEKRPRDAVSAGGNFTRHARVLR